MNFEKKNNIYKTIMIILITGLITFLITAFGYYNYYNKSDDGIKMLLTKQMNEITNNSTNFDSKVSLIKAYLEKYYLGEINEDVMLESAIKGYVDGLSDEYTEYLTQQEYEELMINVNGNYVGVGIYMTQNKDGQICVLSAIEDSPAEAAGIQAGDIILYANNEDLTGMDLTIVANKIKGEEDSTVDLEILRGAKTFVVSLTRKKIEIKYIKSEVIENNIGYIQLLGFENGSKDKFLEHYNKLKEQGIKSLIIDVRNNGGGVVDEVIDIADLILPSGKTIMNTLNRDGDQQIAITKQDDSIDMKIVLLVNENSASASEILAGALQDNKAATIVGATTFGKGVMQEVLKLSNGGALKITIKEFRTPNGNVIEKKGITPDIVIEESEDIENTEDLQLNKAIEVLKQS